MKIAGMFIKNEKGLMMITAYMIIAALSVFAAAAIKMATTEYNFSKRYFSKEKARYLAEAGTDWVSYDLAEKIANGDPEPDYDPDVDPEPARWEDLCGVWINIMSTGFIVTYECVVIDADHQGATSPARERHFQISATATDPNTGVSVTVNDIIKRKKTYVFQHAIFYSKDLEVLPGSRAMTLSGNIHSDGDIYVGSKSTLTIDAGYMEAAGNIYNKRKNNDETPNGNVEIKESGTTNFVKMWKAADTEPLDSRRDDWNSESQNRWDGTVKSGEHGITSKAVAEVYSIQPDGFYAVNADVKVINGDVYDGGTILIEASYADHNTDSIIDADDFGPNDVPVGTITTSTTFYNYREQEYIKMTDIDVTKLAGRVQGEDSSGNPLVDGEGNPVYVYDNHLPANGLMYATRDDAASSQPGIRLYNGAKIDNSTGLTLVTDAPAYIQGDFNSVDKVPVAIISDALNIVSNNWNDDNSDQGLSSRIAVETSVNAAFISGVDDTVGSTYGGGLENYPRLHEDWSNKALNISGSFVSLWDSQVAAGSWGQSSYSSALRNWDYDPDFDTIANLPGFTPQVVGLEKVASYEGDYTTFSAHYTT